MENYWKGRLFQGGKFALPLLILGWLVAYVDREQSALLWQREKNWLLLAGGFLLAMTAICVTFVRWWMLVRALGLPFRLTDAFRMGFLCFVLNFVGAGSVGGDLFRAVFIAREQAGRRTEAVATVVLDRLVGIYALFIVSSIGVLLAGIASSSPVVKVLCNLTFGAALVSTTVVALFLMPQFRPGRRVLRRLFRVPNIGPIIERAAVAIAVYRERRSVLGLTFGMSLAVHTLLPLAIFCAATGIFPRSPTMTEHFIIVPLANVAGALPITPAGLGTFELAMDQLYEWLPETPEADGTIAALAYRFMTILIAMIGVVYYWFSRREVAAVLAEPAKGAVAAESGPTSGVPQPPRTGDAPDGR